MPWLDACSLLVKICSYFALSFTASVFVLQKSIVSFGSLQTRFLIINSVLIGLWFEPLCVFVTLHLATCAANLGVQRLKFNVDSSLPCFFLVIVLG